VPGGSAASLAANVAAAQPTVTGRVIAAWPSFALIAAYELLMRQVRRSGAVVGKPQSKPGPRISGPEGRDKTAQCPREHPSAPRRHSGGLGGQGDAGQVLQRQAWQWALANRAADGALPSGREIARQYRRHE
jgi:hypothetical protein